MATIQNLEMPSIGFECQICGNAQEIKGYEVNIFPVCNECKKDLKEFVLQKRKPNMGKETSVNDVKKKMENLENSIKELISTFHKETGCDVYKIDILKEDNVNINGHRIFVGVKVSVLLHKSVL